MATEQDREIALERLFAAGRSGPPAGDDLVARILAGAAAEVRAAPRQPAAPARRGVMATLVGLIGGWPAMAGMASAAAAGVWLGFSSPDLVDGYLGGGDLSLGEFMPDVSLLAEGG
jgi:hypothetical protein